jgi:hypothetical protein
VVKSLVVQVSGGAPTRNKQRNVNQIKSKFSGNRVDIFEQGFPACSFDYCEVWKNLDQRSAHDDKLIQHSFELAASATPETRSMFEPRAANCPRFDAGINDRIDAGFRRRPHGAFSHEGLQRCPWAYGTPREPFGIFRRHRRSVHEVWRRLVA